MFAAAIVELVHHMVEVGLYEHEVHIKKVRLCSPPSSWLARFQHRSWTTAAPLTHTSPAPDLAYHGSSRGRFRARLGADRGKLFLYAWPMIHAVAPPYTSVQMIVEFEHYLEHFYYYPNGRHIGRLTWRFFRHNHKHTCRCKRLCTFTANVPLLLPLVYRIGYYNNFHVWWYYSLYYCDIDNFSLLSFDRKRTIGLSGNSVVRIWSCQIVRLNSFKWL